MTLILKQSTSIDIRIGPFVDSTDAVTPETSITLAGADQAEVLKFNGAATVTMGGNFVAITGADGWYDYTVATGDVDTVGEVLFVVQDSSVCLPVFVRGMVVEEAVYDSMYLAAATSIATEAKQDTAQTDLTAIVADTGELQTDWTNAGRLDAILDIIAADVVNVDGIVPSAAGDAMTLTAAGVDLIWNETMVGHTTADTSGLVMNEWQDAGRLDLIIDGIKAVTDLLPNSGALSDLATILTDTGELQVDNIPGTLSSMDTKLDTIDNFIDTEIAAIQSTLKGLVPVEGTIGATGNDTTHLHLVGLTYGDDELNGYFIEVFDVSLSEYHTVAITDWVLSTALATVDTLPFTPAASTDTYHLLSAQSGSSSAPTAADVADAVWNEAQGDHVAGGSFGETATEIALILADTNELQVDWTNAGRLDNILDARMAEASISTTGGAVNTVTTLTNLPSITSNWLTAAGINASALNGKGNWNIGKTGYSLTTADWNVGKTGYQLSATGVDDIWNETMAAHTTADTSGLVMNEWQDGGRLDVILDARMAEASINTTGGAVDLVTTTTTATTATNLTNLPTIPANWLTASGLASDAVDEIRDGLLPTQNVAFNNIMFLFVAASDHVTPVTGASTTAATRSIDGGAFGSGTGTLAEVGNGIYQYDASQADMNGGVITFRFTATGGSPGAPDDAFVTIVTGGGV